MKVLIIDDDPKMRELLVECLEPLRYETATASTGRQALELAETERFSVALLDLMLPDYSGIEVFRRIRQRQPQIEIIVLTGHASLETAIEALRMGAYDYVTKPFHARTIQSAVRQAAEKQRFRLRLAALNRATQAMIATLDPDAVLTLAMSEARTMLEAEATAVFLFDKPSRQLILAATANAALPLSAGSRLPADMGIAGWVVQNGQAAIVHDAKGDPRFNPQSDALAGPATVSILAVPLEYRGSITGVIEAVNKAGGDFDERDRELLSTLAGSTAIAVENARLYQAERELRKLVEQSQLQLVQTEKLAATGKLAASLAHEINNPLQAIHNSLQLMLSFQLSADEQKEYLQVADDEIQRLMGLVTGILEFARPSQREVQSTNPNVIVEKVLMLAGKYLQHRHITVKRELAADLPPTLASPDELEQVFINLVLNAVDAMPEGGTLTITSRLSDQNRLAIAFSDTGHGISSEHMDRIFEPFFSTRSEGTGLGLTVSHNVIRRLGGEITVQSTPGQGATFTVWLPAQRE